jgi:hypothetical protein
LKLLVDENLAPGLAEQVADLFPGSVHVNAVGLGSTSDAVIWQYAGANQFTFLSPGCEFPSLDSGTCPPLAGEAKRVNWNSETVGPKSGTVERGRSPSYDHYAE